MSDRFTLSSVTAGRPRGRRRSRRTRGSGGAIYAGPAWLLVLVVIAIPVGWGVYLSLRNESLNTGIYAHYVGLQNYSDVLKDPQFWKSLKITVGMTVLGLLIQLPIGYGLAVLLHRELRATRFFRSALLVPMLLTPVAVGLMWRFMFNSDIGIIDYVLSTLFGHKVDWLGNPTWAFLAIVLVDSWQNIPFVMLLLLAGLQALPNSPIEAAALDGASSFQTFRYVVAPMLRPVILVVLMIRVIESVKLFDIIYIITQGGPGTATENLSTLGYRTGFTFLATSRGAAIGVIVLLMLTPMYLLWNRATRV
jgi:multiple sugar transport system permease protein